ncbi:hypothetical protein ATANTOWER_010277 [Ataeniobius toweri]|uniref:Uncharacterized protein n=1 Tax=Ataeniobius toweri TaxID=208326 RepID=A0ABU7AY63_9TELE|nr:hypothetical protein [Ataeniobius toweri]
MHTPCSAEILRVGSSWDQLRRRIGVKLWWQGGLSIRRQNGGGPGDQFLVLAHCKIQFGKYQGQSFRWPLENFLGYAVYLVSRIMGEEERDNTLLASKHLFLRYTSQIREIGEAVEVYQNKTGHAPGGPEDQ